MTVFKDDDLSSTEKLLDVIRGSDASPASPPRRLKSGSRVARHRDWMQRVRNLRAYVTVGIDLGAENVKIAGIRHHSDGRKEVLELKHLVLTGIDQHSVENRYRDIMPEISAFGKRHRASTVWAAYPSHGMIARHLKVPRLGNKVLARAVHANFKKDADGLDGQSLFDFKSIRPVRGGQGEAIACTVDKQEVETRHAPFLNAGIHLTGLSVYPFAFQGLLKNRARRHSADSSLCLLHIGQTHSYICVYSSNGTLVLNRIIKTALDSMMAPIQNEMREQRRSGDNSGFYAPGFEKDADEPLKLPGEEVRRIFRRLLTADGSVEPDRPIDGGSNRRKMVEMMTPVIDRLGKQVAATMDHHLRHEHGNPFSEILISSSEGVIPEWQAHIERQLDLPVTVLDPADSMAEFPDEAMTGQADHSASISTLRSRFAVAVGIALCDQTVTPNFIFTYQDEERKRSAGQLRHLMVGVISILAAIAIGVVFWQEWQLSRKREYLAQLQDRLEELTPKLSREMISETVSEIQEKRRRLRTALAGRRLPAVFGEIANSTPDSIKLLRIRVVQPEKASVIDKTGSMRIHIEGIITGEEINAETAITTFRTNLRNARLIGQLPSLQHQAEGYFERRKAVLFTLTLDLK